MVSLLHWRQNKFFDIFEWRLFFRAFRSVLGRHNIPIMLIVTIYVKALYMKPTV